MALVYADRVYETTTTTGTGTLDLAGAATGGYQTFVAGIGTTNTCYYCIVDGTNSDWEVGLGTVTDAATDTLSRTTILDSSNAGAAVNFSSGTKDVFCVDPALTAGRVDVLEDVTDITLSNEAENDLLTYTSQSQWATEVATHSPELWWRLGDSTATAADASGNGNTGTHVNTPTLEVTGAITGDSNTAITYDGSTEGTKGAIPSALEVQTVSLYGIVKTTDATGTICGIVPQGTANDGRGIMINIVTGKARLRVGNASGSFTTIVGSVDVDDGEWHHICGTYDGTTLRLYVDGTEDTNDAGAWAGTISYADGHSGPTGGQFYAAAERDNTAGTDPNSGFLGGTVDEVMAFSSTLSATDISDIYAERTAIDGWSNSPLEIKNDTTPQLGGDLDTQSFDITGDFSNATHSNRTQFISSVLNGNTTITSRPNGAGTFAQFSAYNNDDIDNSGYVSTGMNATTSWLAAEKIGTGTYLPLEVRVNSGVAAVFGTDLSTTFSGDIDLQDNDILFDNGQGLLSDNGGSLKTGAGGGTWQSTPGTAAAYSFVCNNYSGTGLILLIGDDGAGGYHSTFHNDASTIELLKINHTDDTVVVGTDLNMLGNNIIGDFSSVTHSDRVMFTTTELNSNTLVGVHPNGTALAAQLNLYDNSDVDNSGFMAVGTSGSDNYIQSKSRGTGSTLPLGFYIDATKYIELGTDGTTTFSGPVQVENGTIIRDWDSGDTDIDGLISGSTFGSLIQGRNTGHLTLGIRDNGADDSFSVLSGSGNYSTDTTYDKICFKVDADGTTTLGGSTTLGGNLDLQSNNIIGDFSNGTLANRVYFQTSTADSSTSLSVLPSGTNNASTYLSFNDSDYDNAGYLATGINATEGYISANKTGTGTLLPLRFHAGGVWRAQLETDGTLSVDPTLNYETLVTADDDIPNKKYVDDAVVGITDVVQDTTPQAGGDFDLQSFDLIGDFGLATAPASRSAFKTNATNDSTVFHVVPNGTGNSSYLSLENNEARANSEALVIACTSTKHQINAGTRGTGSLLPIELQMQGVPCLTVNTNFGLTVTTGTAYETLVTTDDHIPNRKYVLDNSINNVVEDTTPQLGGDLNTNGNDIIFGAGDNIIGDFSNATSDSRTGFQNSNTNASTVLHARPNGTGTASYSIFQNQPAFVGCEYATFGHFGSVAVCGSYSQSGTTANPLELRIESDAALTINTDLSATFADNVEILGESIIGDMSNANPDLRLGFQNSVANSSTVPHVRPSGTATSAYMIFQNQAAFSGCEYVAFGHYGSAAVIASNSQSGLSASPIQFQIEGVNKFELETDGTLNVAGTTNYETLVTADDDIPNKKYVDDNSINNVVEDTTPQLGGDLDIQANNIVGDFGAAAGSRPAFKSSTTNAITAVTAYPNGTGGQSYFVAESDDSANNEIVSLGVTSSVTAINSSKRGTGTTKAFQIQIDSNAALEVETNGTLNVSGTTNYETLVTSDDDIPNKKYVDDVLGKDLGEFTVANLPAASSNANYYALATNASGGRTVVRSDGTNWKVIAVEGATVTT